MKPMTSKAGKPYTQVGKAAMEFDPIATEVAILDRSGRAIWTKTKGQIPSPIRWEGIDAKGQAVETGDYICKIVYPNSKVAYLPFVFMKR
jgi:hypothetical protein